jgi:hypothetical protein
MGRRLFWPPGASGAGAALLLALFVGLGCSKSSQSGGVVQGTVSSSGIPVAAATVAIGATSVTTDAAGHYSLDVDDLGTRIVLRVNAPSYAPTMSIVDARPSVFHYHADIALTKPTTLSRNADGSAAGTVQVNGQSVSVSAPAGSIPSGSHLEVASFSAPSGPGAMETTEGADQRLQTTGMFHIQVVDQAGNPTPVGGGAGIRIGTTDATTRTVPNAQPQKIYQLGDDAQWAPATTTTAIGGDLVAQNAGFWNADRAYKTACVVGHLKSTNKSCGGERVKAGGLDGLYTQDTAGTDGQFCVVGPVGLSQGLTVGATGRSVTFPTSPGTCGNPASCTDIGTVNVADADCPASCGTNETDSPEGCKPQQQQQGGGGCSVTPCPSGMVASHVRAGGCCQSVGTVLSCADSCDGWYECGSQIFGPCAENGSYTSCLTGAANAAVSSCH